MYLVLPACHVTFTVGKWFKSLWFCPLLYVWGLSSANNSLRLLRLVQVTNFSCPLQFTCWWWRDILVIVWSPSLPKFRDFDPRHHSQSLSQLRKMLEICCCFAAENFCLRMQTWTLRQPLCFFSCKNVMQCCRRQNKICSNETEPRFCSNKHLQYFKIYYMFSNCKSEKRFCRLNCKKHTCTGSSSPKRARCSGVVESSSFPLRARFRYRSL